MDFLPHPVAGVEALDIPFVADTPFVFGTDFWDFPKLHGYGHQWASLPAPRLASLAQSWLYFAAISEFLGRPIDYRHFQVGQSVSAKPLLPLLNDWLASLGLASPGDDPQDARAKDEHLRSLLREHYRFLDAVVQLASDFDAVSQSHVKPLPTIILSVKVLCVTLRGVLWHLAHGDVDEALRPWPSPAARLRREIVPARDLRGRQSLSPSGQLLLDVLRLRGWCPFWARKVLTSYGYALAYYFTRLFRTYPRGPSHRRCSDTECVAGNADIFSYVPRHASRGCLCQPKAAPMDQIRAVLEDGGVPLIRLHGSAKAPLRIEVVRMTARTRFVVVSHVWSDGIGNAHTTALPECQLRRLRAHLGELKPLRRLGDQDADLNILSSLDTSFQPAAARRPRYLWIDALCMPPVGASAFLRLRAINKLPAIYQAADRILVLDRTLERTSVAESDSLEQFARFAVSPWMGRCWTFHEAALASACEVQCADGTFDAFSPQPKPRLASDTAAARRRRIAWIEALTRPAGWLRRRLLPKPVPAPDQTLLHAASAAGAGISALIVASLTRSLREEFRSAFSNGVKPSKTAFADGALATDFCTLFVQVWNELAKRTTTVPGDMHLIMANLLGFNTEPLMRIPRSADRMSCILRSMDGIPVSLLFNLDGPRHKPTANHRDRWLPLYPSRQFLSFGSPYTNLRVIGDDLYLPNNTISRQKVALFVCTGDADPFSSCAFTLQDELTGAQYAITLRRKEGQADEFATPEMGPYCIAIQMDPELGSKPPGRIDDLTAAPTTFAGALFRVRRVVTRVKKLYHHNLETDYDGSFELVEEEGYRSSKDLETSSKRATNDDADGSLAGALAEHPRGILRTVYDCPLTVSSPVPPRDPLSSPARGGPILMAQPLPDTWQVVIEREPAAFPYPLPTRPSFVEAVTPVSAYLAVTALDGLVASGSVGLAIAICATMFYRLAMLAKAAMLAKLGLHSLFLMQMVLFPGVEIRLVWDAMHLGLVGVYAFSRATAPGSTNAGGGMDVLDWSFIVWSILGHLLDIAARLAIQLAVVPARFDAYLASLEGDAFREPSRGGGSGRQEPRRWYHRVRLRAPWLGTRGAEHYSEAPQAEEPQLREMKRSGPRERARGRKSNGGERPRGRGEGLLLADVEGQG
ncbi:hypothetical protein VTJ83DRAFT_2668 [Remersonia thermophila]|uniref:Heterokaryon incompatibility domain-containing protein n=1 Tax=Remersonia thermophila TaxID=72144 RepID=A0ABR4DKE6_9PEZI